MQDSRDSKAAPQAAPSKSSRISRAFDHIPNRRGNYLANINPGFPIAADDSIFPSFHDHGANKLQHPGRSARQEAAKPPSPR
jgi:hypothetical protein